MVYDHQSLHRLLLSLVALADGVQGPSPEAHARFASVGEAGKKAAVVANHGLAPLGWSLDFAAVRILDDELAPFQSRDFDVGGRIHINQGVVLLAAVMLR